MKYNQPYGIGDPNGAYINGNPSTGTAGSIPPAESIEYPQREIVNLIADVNLATPSNVDLHQLAKAVQSQLLNSDNDAGTANAYQVTQTPAPTAYFKYMTVVAQIANSNTGASVLNVNALGPKPIVRIDNTPLAPNDLLANSIVCLVYDGTSFQTVWSSNKGAVQSSGILTQNTTIYVNGTTGNDATMDGTSATVVAGGHGPFATIQKAVNTAFTYRPSASYSITIQIADGTYNQAVATPSIPGPALIVNGNAGTPANVTIHGGTGSAFTVNGPNVVTLQNLRFQTNTAIATAGVSANGAGASLTTANTISLGCGSWTFLANGLGGVIVGSHTFAASGTPYLFASYRNGSLNLAAAAVYTISTAISVTATAYTISGGQIEVPGSSIPTFTNPGNVTGQRYSANLNGVINTQGAGANYFPGTIAGGVATGGQYA